MNIGANDKAWRYLEGMTRRGELLAGTTELVLRDLSRVTLPGAPNYQQPALNDVPRVLRTNTM